MLLLWLSVKTPWQWLRGVVQGSAEAPRRFAATFRAWSRDPGSWPLADRAVGFARVLTQQTGSSRPDGCCSLYTLNSRGRASVRRSSTQPSVKLCSRVEQELCQPFHTSDHPVVLRTHNHRCLHFFQFPQPGTEVLFPRVVGGVVLCVRTRTLAQVGSIRRPSVLGSFHATARGIRQPCSSRAFTPLRVLLQRRVCLCPIVLRGTSRAAG